MKTAPQVAATFEAVYSGQPYTSILGSAETGKSFSLSNHRVKGIGDRILVSCGVSGGEIDISPIDADDDSAHEKTPLAVGETISISPFDQGNGLVGRLKISHVPKQN